MCFVCVCMTWHICGSQGTVLFSLPLDGFQDPNLCVCVWGGSEFLGKYLYPLSRLTCPFLFCLVRQSHEAQAGFELTVLQLRMTLSF